MTLGPIVPDKEVGGPPYRPVLRPGPDHRHPPDKLSQKVKDFRIRVKGSYKVAYKPFQA